MGKKPKKSQETSPNDNTEVTCAICKQTVLYGNLQTHRIKVHEKRRPVTQSDYRRRVPPVMAESQLDDDFDLHVPYSDRHLDATRDHDWQRRENGQFGSSPLYDGYGDEDWPG